MFMNSCNLCKIFVSDCIFVYLCTFNYTHITLSIFKTLMYVYLKTGTVLHKLLLP